MKTSNPRGQRREETFENILRKPLAFPAKPAVSDAARDLIARLLEKDPAQRVGFFGGGGSRLYWRWLLLSLRLGLGLTPAL